MQRGPMNDREWMDWHRTIKRRIVNLALISTIAVISLAIVL